MTWRWLIHFLTADHAYAAELQAFFQALQGAMAVRSGPNRDQKMSMFHAFMLSVLSAYGGAAFTALWLGKPTSLLSNDLSIASCVIAFFFVNVMPYGYWIGNLTAVKLITTSYAQLFRSTGLTKFTSMAFEEFKENPSKYYPIPVFGPILFGSILGNMSGFFLKGFEGHLKDGMPWPFQNGLACASFYHFFVHDKTGPIGNYLRYWIGPIPERLGLEDEAFALTVVSAFMQVVGILQLPEYYGPKFSPFEVLGSKIGQQLVKPIKKVNKVPVKEQKAPQEKGTKKSTKKEQ